MSDDLELLTDETLARADSAYRPCAPFEEWSAVVVDDAAWGSGRASIKELSKGDETRLRRAREVAKRAAAIATGAIAGLYDLDQGVTITYAT